MSTSVSLNTIAIIEHYDELLGAQGRVRELDQIAGPDSDSLSYSVWEI